MQEDNNITIGVVQGVLAIRWFDCTVSGLKAHAGMAIKIELVSSYSAISFHKDCIDAVARATNRLGYSNMPVVSGAGHDAVYMANLAPAGMIFIPCKDGISHNEIEDATLEHQEAGCNVLLHAMLERAGT